MSIIIGSDDNNKDFEDNTDNSTQKKQKFEEFPHTILIKFTNNKDGETFYCSVKPTITFRKIFETYQQRHNLVEGSVCFLYEDHKLLPNLTPQDMNFPDGGEIDVMSTPSGGGLN